MNYPVIKTFRQMANAMSMFMPEFHCCDTIQLREVSEFLPRQTAQKPQKVASHLVLVKVELLYAIYTQY